LERGISGHEIARMERFFLRRGAIPTLHLCHFLKEQIAAVKARGFQAIGSASVLEQDLRGPSVVPRQASVEDVGESSNAEWVRVAATAFTEKRRLTHADCEPGGVILGMPGTRKYWARLNSRPSAVGALAIYGNTAILFCDATVADARGSGLHAELIRARMHAARLAGCEVATATTQPGSASYRNYLRSGFSEVYRRITLQLL
jgi:hypothetical protein